ncbi:hypothetical protein ACIOJE_29070 [Kitasatospora sp. NPDC087861]|uniref:hypothetical protein n=1 Tax=Kitasatospora sp. NPDC087861 TaxID=3364070 RepID=UPI00381924AC
MLTDDLTVAVDGHLEPVTAPALQALDILWQTLRELPIGEYQLRAMERLVGSGDTRDLENWMHGDEATDWTLALEGDAVAVVRVSYGDRLTCRQRVAARYRPELVKRPAGHPDQWIVLDLVTGYPATDWLPTESTACEWIRRQVQNANYQSGPARKSVE